MLIRIKWHLVSISLFVLVGLFFLYRQTLSLLQIPPQIQLVDKELPPSNEIEPNTKIPVNVSVADGSHDGNCHQCSLCDGEQHSGLEVVQDWDSSRVLRGAPTKHFRGMLLSSMFDVKFLYGFR